MPRKRESSQPLRVSLRKKSKIDEPPPQVPKLVQVYYFVSHRVPSLLRSSSPSPATGLRWALIMLICDVKAMERTMREMNYDSRRLPLGKLTPSQINAGYNALNIISQCLDQLEKLKHPPPSTEIPGAKKRPKRVPSSVSESARIRRDLLEACNLFYTRVPHDFGMRMPPLIDTPDAVKVELDLMKSLQDIEVAFNIIQRENRDNLHPADRHYQALNCNISPLAAEDKMLELCLRTYFTFDGTINEQVKGTPMGSPISGFIAEAVLQRLESLVFQHHRPKFWAPYVDDTFVVIERDQVLTFEEHLNAVFPDI
nr:unnamed protein product [Spirometra erinaceieuropaei]